MASNSNDVFKLVSLRGPIQLSEEVTSGIDETDLFKNLNSLKPKPAIPQGQQDKFRKIIGEYRIMPKEEAQNCIITPFEKAISAVDEKSIKALGGITIQWDDINLALKDLVNEESFKNCMAWLSDTWLVIRLSNLVYVNENNPVDLKNTADINTIEKLIRAGWLAQRLAQAPDSLKPLGACESVLHLSIVFPRKWRPEYYRQKQFVDAYAADQKANQDKKKETESKLDQLRKHKDELLRELKDIERIQGKAIIAFAELYKETQENFTTKQPDAIKNKVVGRRKGKEDPLPKITSNVLSISKETFQKKLNVKLNGTEPKTFKHLAIAQEPSVSINIIQDQLRHSWERIHQEAADTCSQIHVWEDEVTRPDTRSQPENITEKNRPSVRDIGFGELIVARERLIGYEANEIAHIENVLPHEDRLREHERITSKQEVTETETLKEKSSEKDLETTDRNEIQTQSQKAIKQQFSVNAGINTSGKYGVTTVSASLQAGFSRSVDESRSSTSNIAKEIVAKAVESSRESARELRRTTVSEQIRELNRHGIIGLEKAFSGVYYWVEKIHEVELRHYGTRLMVEFYIPEPGLSLLPVNNTSTQLFRKPAPFTIKPQDIEPPHHLCLASIYGANNIEPPPPLNIQVGYEWASTPEKPALDTKENLMPGNTPVDVKVDTIPIPEGYVATSATAMLSEMSFGSHGVRAALKIGGASIEFSLAEPPYDRFEVPLNPIPSPQGLPISILIRSHQYRAATLHVVINCLRTDDAMNAWRLKTFESLKEAHDFMQSEYERKLAQAAIKAGFAITGKNPEENRAMEIDELEKWAIQTMRISPFNFDGVSYFIENGIGQQEIDPVKSDQIADIQRFFEDGFEWRQMSYFLYPYYWGRRELWGYRRQLQDPDPIHQNFLQAGGAKVIVPVTPGYELHVLHYLHTPSQNELERVTWKPPSDDANSAQIPPDEAEDVWLEVLTNKNMDFQRGTGTLIVTQGSADVIINHDSMWIPDARDIGRELYIGGECYSVIKTEKTADGVCKIQIDRPYELSDNKNASYASGSVLIGTPWRVRIPTSLVILSEEKSKLLHNIERNEYLKADPPSSEGE